LPIHHGSDMVSSWTEADRQYLAELCREHDRMMAEHAASERAREPAADDELVFKVIEDATPPAPQPEPAPFDQLQRYVLVSDLTRVEALSLSIDLPMAAPNASRHWRRSWCVSMSMSS